MKLRLRTTYAVLLALMLASPIVAEPYHAPRTSWGVPDLQGTWTNFSLTRLERAPGVPARIRNGDDLAAIERSIYENILPDDPLGNKEAEWWPPSHLARIDGELRTSWITSPADGRVPYTQDGLKRRIAARARGLTDFDGPESRNASERCLEPGFSPASPPMQNSPTTPGYVFVQTREAVVIMAEADSEVRIIRLGGRHDAPGGRMWNGDSVGHWEKDTLVVDTVGFQPEEAFRAPILYIGADAHVIERFTRVGKDEIRYAFTVEDPATYREPWSGLMVFRPRKEPIYEFACHEGNTSLAGILQGARYIETHSVEVRPTQD
ncbi:MAG: hypothetical protein ACHP9T_01580 [Caulobacterales bacterium]|jgi:hypothetical protein